MCFERIDALFKRVYNNGILYNSATKDVASHFFFDRIPKGSYIIEYSVRVNNQGKFTNGIAPL